MVMGAGLGGGLANWYTGYRQGRQQRRTLENDDAWRVYTEQQRKLQQDFDNTLDRDKFNLDRRRYDEIDLPGERRAQDEYDTYTRKRNAADLQDDDALSLEGLISRTLGPGVAFTGEESQVVKFPLKYQEWIRSYAQWLREQQAAARKNGGAGTGPFGPPAPLPGAPELKDPALPLPADDLSWLPMLTGAQPLPYRPGGTTGYPPAGPAGAIKAAMPATSRALDPGDSPYLVQPVAPPPAGTAPAGAQPQAAPSLRDTLGEVQGVHMDAEQLLQHYTPFNETAPRAQKLDALGRQVAREQVDGNVTARRAMQTMQLDPAWRRGYASELRALFNYLDNQFDEQDRYSARDGNEAAIRAQRDRVGALYRQAVGLYSGAVEMMMYPQGR